MTMPVMGSMPNILLAVKSNAMLQVIRDMLRRCSVEDVESYSSLKDAKAVLRAHARKWDIFAVDSRFPETISEVEAIREEMGPHIKILLLTSMPTTGDDVLQAAMAGINEIVATPCSQIDLEEKIDGLMGKPVAPRKVSRTSILYSGF